MRALRDWIEFIYPTRDLRRRDAVSGSKRECVRRAICAIDQRRVLDRIIPLGERHFRRAVHEFVQHYHLERNHQGLGNALIDGAPARSVGAIRRRSRLGGLLNYYERAA